MRSKRSVHLIALLAAVAAGRASAEGCVKEAQRNLQLDTSGVTKIAITAGAGELQIKGERGSKQLTAKGTACASDQELIEKIQLESRRDGSTLSVKVVLPDADGFLGYARLDLNITLPDDIDLNVTDSSGDTRIDNVRALALTDSSGDVEIRGVSGDASVTDSSGDLEIERVGGELTLADSSGDIEVKDVSGTVKVDVDSSGGIRIEQAGAVHILTDSSGDIDIEKVKGDVLIDNDTSGDISVAEVRGKFTVRNDGGGSIRQQNVAGAVSVPR